MCQVLFGAGYSAMNKIKMDGRPTHRSPVVTGSLSLTFISCVLSTHSGTLKIFEQARTFSPLSQLTFNIFIFVHISESSW